MTIQTHEEWWAAAPNRLKMKREEELHPTENCLVTVQRFQATREEINDIRTEAFQQGMRAAVEFVEAMAFGLPKDMGKEDLKIAANAIEKLRNQVPTLLNRSRNSTQGETDE